MGKCIVFVNQKGGVGKTTSAINIGAYIALAGKKVLLVDDIYTTGSTVNEIANNLIKSGVKDVGIITIAKD